MQWLGTAFLFAGTFALTDEASIGSFGLRLCGDLLWTAYGIKTNQWAIVVCELAFAMIDIKGMLAL